VRAERLATAALVALASVSAAAQQPALAPPQPPPGQGEIVVLGDIPVAELPTQAARPPGPASTSRTLGSEAAFFIACVGLPKRRANLRAIVDNGPENVFAQRALHDFIVRNRACYPGAPDPPPDSPALGDCNPQIVGGAALHTICRTVFDRGAIFERTLRRYAPDYALSREQTFDPLARRRFGERQQARNHLAPALDRQYFDTVACFVQISPGYGQALLRAAPGSAAETRARQYLIGYGSPCVGGARTVKADASQFRAYTAEAVYAWIAAAKGASSLVR
jgi:hypothetical protein